MHCWPSSHTHTHRSNLRMYIHTLSVIPESLVSQFVCVSHFKNDYMHCYVSVIILWAVFGDNTLPLPTTIFISKATLFRDPVAPFSHVKPRQLYSEPQWHHFHRSNLGNSIQSPSGTIFTGRTGRLLKSHPSHTETYAAIHSVGVCIKKF